MKKIILLLSSLIMPFMSYSQIDFNLLQDPALALFKDKHGNTPFTADVRLEAMVIGYSDNYGAITLGPTFEYADLKDFSFTRFGIQGGYTFKYMVVPFTQYRKTYELTFMVGRAWIKRGGDSSNVFASYELTTQISYFINNWLGFSAKGTLMQRGDLGEKYDDKSGSYRPWDWKPNGYVGITFRMPTKISKKYAK